MGCFRVNGRVEGIPMVLDGASRRTLWCNVASLAPSVCCLTGKQLRLQRPVSACERASGTVHLCLHQDETLATAGRQKSMGSVYWWVDGF